MGQRQAEVRILSNSTSPGAAPDENPPSDALVGRCPAAARGLRPDAVAANPWSKAEKKKPAAPNSDDFELTETNGPWLIMAATFTGEGSEDQARTLVKELRGKYKLKAYTYQKKFDFSKPMEGRGVDRFGGPQQMHYQNGDVVVETAVLVGDYQQVGDETARKTLKKIKYMQPEALTKVEHTTPDAGGDSRDPKGGDPAR